MFLFILFSKTFTEPQNITEHNEVHQYILQVAKRLPPKKAEINGASSTCKRVLFNFIISFFIIHEIAGTGSHPTQRFVLGLPRALGVSQDTLSMKLFFALPLFGNSMICLFHPRLHLEDNNEYVI